MTLREALIENNSIALNQKASTWEEAVKISTDLLVKSGAIEERYYDDIIAKTKEYGPYYIIMPGVAMPHARPESGVIKDSFSLITLETPVCFGGDTGDVNILITLAATSSENHNEFGLIQVADLFEDEDNIERIKNCKTIEEILEIIQ